MKINLRSQYRSIATLTSEDLPDLSVLIGRNGAGKSQLLEALEGGWAVIPGIRTGEIERYDMVSFHTTNAHEGSRHSNHFARVTAEAFLSPPTGQPPVEVALEIFDQFASDIERDFGAQARDDFERNLKDEVQQVSDFAVFATSDRESPYKRALYEQVMAPLNPGSTGHQDRVTSTQRINSFNGNQAALLTAAMKLTAKLPHELTYDDIMSASHFEGETLSNSISAVFATYKVEQFLWAHNRIEREYVHFDELIAEYRTTYPPPWETLRKILSEMRDAAGEDGLFDFEFSDPEGYKLDMSNYEGFSFRAEMTNRSTGAQYDLDSLSSGERVLMALCLASFNQYLGRSSPKLLLLDELDAVLHPSMISALVRTLKTLFLPKGTKALMTSHSPMTVAALDEPDIFRVVRTGGDVRISSTTKSEAIDELSEGLATVDVGLRIAAYEGARVTILTEGHNAKHLKRWVALNFPDEVHVMGELEQHSNDDQLLSYGRLLAKMNTSTHFVIVWDCDAAKKAETLRRELPTAPTAVKVTPFSFKKRRDNTIACKGIENNYDESILEPYSTTTTSSDGAVLGRGFQRNRKTEFANHVQREGKPQYFTHFQDLHDIISRILDSPREPPSLHASEQ